MLGTGQGFTIKNLSAAGDALSGWTPWSSSQGTQHRPWHSSTAGLDQPWWDPQQVLDWTAAQAASRVYASMTDLAAALHARW